MVAEAVWSPLHFSVQRKPIATWGGRHCHFLHFLDEEPKAQKEVGTQLEKAELEPPRFRLWQIWNTCTHSAEQDSVSEGWDGDKWNWVLSPSVSVPLKQVMLFVCASLNWKTPFVTLYALESGHTEVSGGIPPLEGDRAGCLPHKHWLVSSQESPVLPVALAFCHRLRRLKKMRKCHFWNTG